MSAPATSTSRSGADPWRRAREGVVVGAVAFALSPLLVELAGQLAREGWARYALVFPPLLLWQIAREGPQERAPRLGFGLVALALLVELATVGIGAPRFGRPALGLAGFGLCRALGLTSAPSAVLAFFAVPLPYLVVARLGQPLAELHARIAAALVGGVEAAPRARGVVDLLGETAGTLTLSPAESGVPLAALLAGLGWFGGLRRGHGLPGCVARALGLALAGPLLQLGVVVAAALALASGHALAAARLTAVAPWALGGVVGLVVLWRTGARRP